MGIDIFCGVEGGGSHTTLVIMTCSGQILYETESNISTNHWLIGMEECQKLIIKLVQEAKEKAGLDPKKALKSLGLSLSGCEQQETNRQLSEGIKNKCPNLAEVVVVCSDTVGSIATATKSGGVVLISGTGSNCLLVNPDGSIHRCGGWGYLISDEGSAYWIAYQAIKIWFNESDNLEDPPANTDLIVKFIKEHFSVSEQSGILEHCYGKFDKSFFSELCSKIAQGASDHDDELCKRLFYEAGFILAQFVVALAPKIDPILLRMPGGFHIVCVGKVWKSWDLLRNGFLDGLKKPRKSTDPRIEEVTLLELQASVAVGAAVVGAKAAKCHLPLDFEKNANAFFHSVIN